MNDCVIFMELISRRIDGDLSAGEAAALDEHLERCAKCSSILKELKALSEITACLQAEPPENMAGDIMGKVAAEAGGRRGPGKRTMLRRCAAAAAVIVLSVLTAVIKDRYMTGGIAAASVEAASNKEDEETAADGSEQAADKTFGATMSIAGEDAVGSSVFADEGAGENGNDAYAYSERTAGATKAVGAPALPYSRTFCAIMVIYGGIPDALSGCEAVEAADAEFHIFVPAEDFDGLCASLDAEGVGYTVYMDEPNISPESDEAIVVVYEG